MSSTASRILLLAAALVGCGGSDKKDAEEADDSSGGGGGLRYEDVRKSTDDEEEEGTDDIEVEGLKGRLEPHQIDAGVQPHQQGLARCYQSHLKSTKFLGGKLVLKVIVGPEGTVKHVTIPESDLGSWAVEKCMLEIARGMTFAKPKGGDGEADFTLPLDFTSGRGRVLWWEEEKIETVVAEKLAELDECEQQVGVVVPSNVWVTLYFANKGEVRSVGFSSPEPEPIQDTWADCAAQVVAAWVMPDPMGKIAKSAFRFRPN
ncbi:MAG TPA: AgmX/PglI C-terminal domain-containing protein [Kofleriaceae bacterium]|nr:AgmX/PglI C-terminal domain-containing protein [Kofleriaceae bacterium]